MEVGVHVLKLAQLLTHTVTFSYSLFFVSTDSIAGSVLVSYYFVKLYLVHRILDQHGSSTVLCL
jgi:hypothetical protein